MSKSRRASYKKLLDNPDRCYYCRSYFGESVYKKDWIDIKLEKEVEHKIPYCYVADNSYSNLCYACNICNGFKNGKIFENDYTIRKYLAKKWYTYYLNVPDLLVGFLEEKQVVLLFQVEDFETVEDLEEFGPWKEQYVVYLKPKTKKQFNEKTFNTSNKAKNKKSSYKLTLNNRTSKNLLTNEKIIKIRKKYGMCD